MKIITQEKAYVQLNDLMYLLRSFENKPIPAVVFEKCFSKPMIVVDSNRYDFVEFSEPEAVEFFRNWQYSVDFLALQEFTDDELVNKSMAINEERNAIAVKYNQMTDDEKSKNYHMVNECELLEFQMYSIRDVLWFRQGHLKFKLPAGIAKTQQTKQESGIKKFFKRFKKENDQ